MAAAALSIGRDKVAIVSSRRSRPTAVTVAFRDTQI
jgi:hypothetical protein